MTLFDALFGVKSKPRNKSLGGHTMTATAKRAAPRKTASPKSGLSAMPATVQDAVAKTDPKTRRFIKEALRLQESGLLGKAFG